MITYSQDELLPLSGIQHFFFCRRQWALITVERQWQENYLTVDGKLLHERADDPFFTEVREGIVITRAMPVASYSLGLAGICDVVEFTPSSDGVNLPRRGGKYAVRPVEYKRGKEKWDRCDEAQLCAQAICLEEMLLTSIPSASLFYGETRRRVEVALSQELRQYVRAACEEMHRYFERGYTPQVKTSKGCRSCSMVDLCLPDLQEKGISARRYIERQVEGAE